MRAAQGCGEAAQGVAAAIRLENVPRFDCVAFGILVQDRHRARSQEQTIVRHQRAADSRPCTSTASFFLRHCPAARSNGRIVNSEVPPSVSNTNVIVMSISRAAFLQRRLSRP